MSELLRAICDASCIDSQPAFYNAQIDTPVLNGAQTFKEIDYFLNCKSDTYFLMTGYCQLLTFYNAAQTFTGGTNDIPSVQIANSKDQLNLGQGFTIKPNLNYTLNTFLTLPEYYLFRPNDTIIVRQNVFATDVFGATFNQTANVCLIGIEYRFDDSMTEQDWSPMNVYRGL